MKQNTGRRVSSALARENGCERIDGGVEVDEEGKLRSRIFVDTIHGVTATPALLATHVFTSHLDHDSSFASLRFACLRLTAALEVHARDGDLIPSDRPTRGFSSPSL